MSEQSKSRFPVCQLDPNSLKNNSDCSSASKAIMVYNVEHISN